MNELLNICSAFGLSGAAGLNAYIPLFFLSLLANRGMVHLTGSYAVMGQPWVVIVLGVLVVYELVVDKIPGADHVNDMVQTEVRPTAGAILFGSQMGTVTGVHPGVWLVIGLLMGGGVHAVKSLARPVVNVSTLGIGGPVVSSIENLVSTVVSLLALLAPVFGVIAMVIFGWLMYKAFKNFRAKRRPMRVEAVAVREVSVGQMEWSVGGGPQEGGGGV